MNKTREQFIDSVMADMSLEQKVGQCFTFCWRGSMITPMLLDSIEKLHVGGLRVEPYIVESSRSTYYGEGGLDPNFRAPADYFTIAKTWISPGRPGPIIPPELYAERINRIQQIATSP